MESHQKVAKTEHDKIDMDCCVVCLNAGSLQSQNLSRFWPNRAFQSRQIQKRLKNFLPQISQIAPKAHEKFETLTRQPTRDSSRTFCR